MRSWLVGIKPAVVDVEPIEMNKNRSVLLNCVHKRDQERKQISHRYIEQLQPLKRISVYDRSIGRIDDDKRPKDGGKVEGHLDHGLEDAIGGVVIIVVHLILMHR